MYLTTEQLRKRLSQIHTSIEQYWPSLGILVDEAHAAGRQEGIEIGRNQAAAERISRPVAKD